MLEETSDCRSRLRKPRGKPKWPNSGSGDPGEITLSWLGSLGSLAGRGKRGEGNPLLWSVGEAFQPLLGGKALGSTLPRGTASEHGKPIRTPMLWRYKTRSNEFGLGLFTEMAPRPGATHQDSSVRRKNVRPRTESSLVSALPGLAESTEGPRSVRLSTPPCSANPSVLNRSRNSSVKS